MNFNGQKDGLIKVDIDKKEFEEIIQDITENSSFLSLKEHIQHMKSSRYEHCYAVAYYTYIISKRLIFTIGEKRVLKGKKDSMLIDILELLLIMQKKILN